MARTPVPIPIREPSPPPEPSQAERRAAHNLRASRFARGVGRWRSAAPQSPPRDPVVRPRAPESAVTFITDRPLTADDLRGEWPGDDGHLTLGVAVAIVNYVRSGSPVDTAAALAGIRPGQFRAWQRAPGAAFEVFRGWLTDAEAVAETRALALVAASNDWRVAAIFLSRRWPGHWSQRGERRAQLLRSLTASADSGQRSAAQARMRRVRPWEHRTNVRAAKARRAAERSDAGP